MKYEFYIDKDKKLFLDRYEGKITKQDWFVAIQKAFNHPDWQKGQNSLCDLREAKLMLSSDEMRQVVASFSPEDQTNMLAVVVSSDFQFGMTRMFELISEETCIWKEYKIFKDINAAKEWLGIGNYTNPKIKWLT